MRYRTFKKINEKVSLLGMGAMRFPETTDGSVDHAAPIIIKKKTIDAGINIDAKGFKEIFEKALAM